ncbi:S-adenosyl-L-methionine-dependent methyltransferase [Setomelanomma holmii]|uniref:S-adenosyl-L-methionine-dependent methyltransferase n=1 Tax=Setomelanomma holmii TaxID=210430 RepID=A0A9P4H6B9_9PLEO|nr:S-adenosyl-L-methionine-dependent methyltransferase [Setomelanomma holmii]
MANQDLNNSRFTAEAAAWDSNIKHIESTDMAFEATKRYVSAFNNSTNKDLDVLELGCGTGLLSFKLAPHVRSLVGIDTADGMVSAFNTKLAALPASGRNLCAINHFLTSADSPELQGAAAALSTHRGEQSQPPYRFDLIVSHLTLHHVPSLPEIFATLKDCLKTGGVIALTDYEYFGKEAIRFHPVSKRPGVERHGLKKEETRDLLVGVGFNEVRVEKAYILRKEVDPEEGMETVDGEMAFPFLMFYGAKG